MTAPVAEVRPQAKEEGITGTTNFYGDLLTEMNSALTRQAGYGQAGTRAWGEWEKLARTDPDCATGLDKTVAPLRDSRLSVRPAEHDAIPEAVAQAQANFVLWALGNVSPRWVELSQTLARGFLTYGFSLHEKCWADCEHPSLPGRRGTTIARLAERLPQSLYQSGPWVERVEPSGEVVLDYVRQMGVKAGVWTADIRIPAAKLLHLTWNRSGGNYAGYSVFRPVWYIAKQRAAILKLIGVSAIREGAGVPSASSTGPEAADLTEEQRSELCLFLMSMVFHENAAIVMPRGWKVEWIYSPSSNKGHLIDLYNSLGTLILRVMSAQQVALGTGATGSRSVGEVHNGVANEFVQGVVSVLEGGLADLARELVIANWGPQPAYPVPAVTLKRSQLGAKEKAEAAKAAVEAGLLTPTLADENSMREDLGLEAITAEERDAHRASTVPAASGEMPAQGAATSVQDTALNGAQVEAAKAVVQSVAEGQLPRETGVRMLEVFFRVPFDTADQMMGEVGRGFAPQSAPSPQPQTPTDAKAKASASPSFVPRRPLRASEQHLDLAGMDGFLAASKDAFERGAKPLVAEMLTKALPAVKLAMVDGDPSELASVKLDSARLDAFVGEYLAGVHAEGGRQVRAELLKGAPPPVRVTAAAVGGGGGGPSLLSAQRLQVVRRITTRLQLDLEARAIDVVRTGGDASEVVADALADQVDSAALRTDSALLTTKAWNGGRDDAARELGGVAAVELSAVLDSGTCPVCEGKDGQRFAFDSVEHDANVPPLRDCEGRDNCRCLLVYLTEGA